MPQCIPPEFFDPFLNRCRLPDTPVPPDVPAPYNAPGAAAINDSTLYRALAASQTRSASPIGAVSGALTFVGIAVAWWAYRRKNRS